MAKKPRRLSEEDKQRLENYLSKGYNSTERKPFRPFLLLFILFLIVTAISIFSLYVADINGLSGGR